MSNDAKTGEIVLHVPHNLELQSVSDEDLRDQIRAAVGLTEDAVRRLAALWVEATRRNLDLSEMKFALAAFLPAVARGELLPALVVSMAGQTRSLQRLADLPVHEQRRLADGGLVEVFRPDRGVVEKPLRGLSFPELASVVVGGRVLSADEQRRAFKNRPTRQARKSTTVTLRLAPDTYNDAARAAADAGMTIDDYLRRLIIAGMRLPD